MKEKHCRIKKEGAINFIFIFIPSPDPVAGWRGVRKPNDIKNVALLCKNMTPNALKCTLLP
jgi:hypothetical protein